LRRAAWLLQASYRRRAATVAGQRWTGPRHARGLHQLRHCALPSGV